MIQLKDLVIILYQHNFKITYISIIIFNINMYMLIFFMMDIYYSVIYFFVLEKKKKQSEQWEGLVQSQLSITWKKLLIISEKNIITGEIENICHQRKSGRRGGIWFLKKIKHPFQIFHYFPWGHFVKVKVPAILLLVAWPRGWK